MWDMDKIRASQANRVLFSNIAIYALSASQNRLSIPDTMVETCSESIAVCSSFGRA